MTNYSYSTDERPFTEEEMQGREQDRQRHLEQFRQVLSEAKDNLRELQEGDIPEPESKQDKGERNNMIDWLLGVVHAAKKDIQDVEDRPPTTTIVEQIRVGPEHPQYEYGWTEPYSTSMVPVRVGHEPEAVINIDYNE